MDDQDARQGMDWWNRQPESERRAWLKYADSARPADAWEAYKRMQRAAGREVSHG